MPFLMPDRICDSPVRRIICRKCGAVVYTRSRVRKYCSHHSRTVKYSGVGRQDDYSKGYSDAQ